MLHDIQDCLEIIAETSGKNDKIKLIKEMLGKYDQAGEVLNYALSPFITFGVATTIMKPSELPLTGMKVPNDKIEPMFFDVLNRLASREVTGNAAVELVNEAMSLVDFKTANLLYNVVQKDLRAGFSISSVNKAAGKKLIHEFNTMLAHKYELKRVRAFPVYVEPKLDGMRCVAIVDNTGVKFVSRNGKPITTIPHLEKQIAQAFFIKKEDVLYIDGELTAGDNFNISISALRKKDEKAQSALFHVFDVLTEAEFKGEAQTQMQDRAQRVGSLNAYPNLCPVSRKLVNTDEEVLEAYQKERDKGEEGIIVKDPEGIYEPKRSYNWMKIKDCNDADLEVVGYFEGEGKYEGMLGGLIVDHEGVEVRVGSGLSDKQRQGLWDERDSLAGKIVEVQYHEVTPDGSLRHPRYIKFREDKE